MDVRPGGAWWATMLHGPERLEIVFSGTYLEVVEPERLVMTIEATEPESSAAEAVTLVLRDLGAGRTEMTVTQRGGHLPADEYSRAMRGWLVFLDRLSDHLKARHDPVP